MTQFSVSTSSEQSIYAALELSENRLPAISASKICGHYPTSFNPFHAEERVQGNFEPGRYAWVGQSREPLEVPVRWRGRQGIFRVPARLFEVGEGT